MDANDKLLDRLQSDIVAVLKNTPSIPHAYVFSGTEKDFRTRIEKTLGTRTNNASGKRGLAVQVLPIFVTEAEKNLPGPPLKLRCQILILENLTLNRGANGTGMTTSQAAINALQCLHQHQFGSANLYAEKNPIVPEKAEAGFEAHVLTLFSYNSGSVAEKTLGVDVTSDLVGGAPAEMTLIFAGPATAGKSITLTRGAVVETYVYGTDIPIDNTQMCVLLAAALNASSALVTAVADQPSYSLVITAKEPGTGTNTELIVTKDGPYPYLGVWENGEDPEMQLSLTTATPGAAIRYTTDGTYPTPSNGTLYTAPVTGLLAGTEVRAAAYAAGLNPSDCLEFTVTE